MAATALLVVMAAGGAVLVSLKLGRALSADWALLDYQLGKVGRGDVPYTVFLGDSTLGNSISADEWAKLSGRPALNLALTGSFGYEGTYNILRRVLAWGKPRHVVIIQSPDRLLRGPSKEGFRLTAPDGFSRIFAFLRFVMNTQEIGASVRYLARCARAWPLAEPCPAADSRVTAGVIFDDYVHQGPRDDDKLRKSGNSLWLAAYIQPAGSEYIKLIFDLCETSDLDCIYAHGPLIEPLCNSSQNYFDAVADLLARDGVHLASKYPVCMPIEDGGDSMDHVRTGLKRVYTRKYYDRIAPALRP